MDKGHKEEFLSTIADNAYNRRLLFKILPSYEKEYGKDVADFNKLEILSVLEDLDSLSYKAIKTVFNLMKRYSDWMVYNRYSEPDENDYAMVTKTDIQGCINPFKKDVLYASYEDFLDVVEEIRNPVDRFIVFCFFEGIKGDQYEEIINMKLEDIDPKTNTVSLCTGRVLSVHSEFCKVAKEADEVKEFEAELYNWLFLPNDGKIVKMLGGPGSKEKTVTKTSIVIKVSRLKDEFEYSFMTIPRLQNSGFVHYCKMEMAKMGGLTPEEFVKTDECRELVNRYCYTKNDFLIIRKIRGSRV